MCNTSAKCRLALYCHTRPPQEDSTLVISSTSWSAADATGISGYWEINAVDAAGVHPAAGIGSERYMPFRERRPEEILTQ